MSSPIRLPMFAAALALQHCSASVPPSCGADAAGDEACPAQGSASIQKESVLLQQHNKMRRTLVADEATLNVSQPLGDARTTCRFAKLDWGNALLTDEAVQDQYVAAALHWDGKFASPGVALSNTAITRDHVNLNDDGSIASIAGYSAPSKENLHISMLAVVLDGEHPLAWNFLGDTKEEGEAEALRRLELIMGEYEKYLAGAPGCGGFFPWFGIDLDGMILPETKQTMPALDNGQMAWALVAAQTVLEEKGHTELAARFKAYIEVLKDAPTFFLDKEKGRVYSSSKVKGPLDEVGVGVIKMKGMLRDPFEGELMIMWMDLMANDVPAEPTLRKMWQKVKKSVQRKDYTSDALPNGPITVEGGWRYSAHEQWKYLVLPYFENEVVRAVFKNNERARTWNSVVKGIPGLMAACYNAEGVYYDSLGIESISYGYTEPADSELMVSPYGAFPLILADRGLGLAWHRAMLGRPNMQSQYGSVEASEAKPDGHPPRVAKIMTWDTKVSSSLAMVGGTGQIIKRFLQKEGKMDRFMEILADQYTLFSDTDLSGEDTPFAPPPGLDESDNVETGDESSDFSTCV